MMDRSADRRKRMVPFARSVMVMVHVVKMSAWWPVSSAAPLGFHVGTHNFIGG